MNDNQELLSLWVGPKSQRLAHHFYALQAQQFFDDEDDPTNQNSLWTFQDKDMIQKFPRMIIFDTASDNLTRIRKVNHKKLLKKMKQPSKSQMYFNFQFLPQQQQQQQNDADFYLYQNWRGKQENYVLIDKKFNDQRCSFDLWQNLYKYEQDLYEDKVRKHLQRSDYLRLFTLCSDGDRLGFTNKLLEYLKDQCPKKSIVMNNISNSRQDSYFNEVCLPLLGGVTNQVSLLVDIQQQKLGYQFYLEDNFYANISPAINAFLTPFILKTSNSSDYLQKIDSGNRNLFDMAFTLPIINEQEELNKSTNIFSYIKRQQEEKNAKKQLQTEQQNIVNRINCLNHNYLNILNTKNNQQYQKKLKKVKNVEKITVRANKTLAQSYVLKGHFKNITQYFTQKNNPFEMKYLRGILAPNPYQNLKYDESYKKDYGQIVEAFPFHTVLYQHSAFGPSIRNYVKVNQTFGYQHELLHQWTQNTLTLSDRYSELNGQDSD